MPPSGGATALTRPTDTMFILNTTISSYHLLAWCDVLELTMVIECGIWRGIFRVKWVILLTASHLALTLCHCERQECEIVILIVNS